MGNSQKPQQGSFDPKALQQYHGKFQKYRNQYSEYHNHNSGMPGAYQAPQHKPTTVNMDYSQIQRKIYIYKSSFDIEYQPYNGNYNFKIKFSYDCKTQNQSFVRINIGVEEVKQDQVTKQTIYIRQMYKQEGVISNGRKQQYEKTFTLTKQQINIIYKLGILVRLFNRQSLESSEYSLMYFQRMKHWKVVMEVYFNPINQKTYQLEDMFGGGEENSSQQQQCIICFTQLSTVMVKPCNHLCLCSQCSQSVANHSVKNCPICRKNISGFIKLNKTK